MDVWIVAAPLTQATDRDQARNIPQVRIGG